MTTRSHSPVNGAELATVSWSDAGDVDAALQRATVAFREWRVVPAPVRGQVVRRFAELLREHQQDLATLVALEVGKIGSEAAGEVQEMIDVCDFAVGLSRQLYGKTISLNTVQLMGDDFGAWIATWLCPGCVGGAFDVPFGVLAFDHAWCAASSSGGVQAG